MKLSSRLIVLIGVLVISILAAIWLATLHNTRQYLESQLSTHAQDTATSLGLAISTSLAEGDTAIPASMIDAIFDRGDYVEIRLTDRKGAILQERKNALLIEGIPEWFVALVPLRAPRMHANVVRGWTQYGAISVVSHAGYAYQQLWRTGIDAARWAGLAGIVAMVIGVLALHRLMRPLDDVEAQARAICNKEFPQIEQLPGTPELRRIVIAMNQMSAKVQGMIVHLEKLALKMRIRAYRHPVTELPNKRELSETLDGLLAAPGNTLTGSLILVHIEDFKLFNDARGYEAGDARLRDVAGCLSKVCETDDGLLLSHLAGGDFCVLNNDPEESQAVALSHSIRRALGDLRYFAVADTSNIALVSCLLFRDVADKSTLLAAADHSLQRARNSASDELHVEHWRPTDSEIPVNASARREQISRAIAENRLEYRLQPVWDASGRRVLHRELLARLALDDGADGQVRTLTAGEFIPVAAQIGLSAEIDRAAIRHAVTLLKTPGDVDDCLAVNLAPKSLDDPAFVDWLIEKLDQLTESRHRLHLEIPEFGVHARLHSVHTLISKLRERGVHFGLDRYGRTDQSITNLKRLKLDYIKIDGTYVQSLADREEHQFFIQALSGIAHGLDIKVFIEAVENESTWTLAQSFDVDGAQGHFLGKPV